MAGIRVVDLIREIIRPSDVISREPMENSISVVMTAGGGTNAILPLRGLAWK